MMVELHALTERMLEMGDTDWRRHANPWSVRTRFTCMLLLVSAIWSHVWVGCRAMLARAAPLGLIVTVLPIIDRMVWRHADLTDTVPGDPMPGPLMPLERTNT